MQVFQRQAAFFQVLFHKNFIAFCDVFYRKFTQKADIVGQASGNFSFYGITVTLEHVGLAGKHIRHAQKFFSLANMQLQGYRLDTQG